MIYKYSSHAEGGWSNGRYPSWKNPTATPEMRCRQKTHRGFPELFDDRKIFGGVTYIYQMFELHASFLAKINRTESLPIFESLMKSEVVTFQDLWNPSKRCYLTCFLAMKIFPMPLIWEIFPMRGLAPVGNISASRWVTLLDGLEILRHFAETTPKLPAHCGTWFDLGTNGRPLIQRHITKPSVRSQGSRQVAKAGGKS